MEKVKLYTHNDLDGVSCQVLAEVAFGAGNVDTTIVKNPADASKKIKEFIIKGEYLNYNDVFITDISVDEEVAELIDELEKEEFGRFTLLDHHKTAEWLNDKYGEWAFVTTEWSSGKKASGTDMFWTHLMSRGILDHGQRYSNALKHFVEKVRRYDTWVWKNIGDTKASELSQLLYLIGVEEFVKEYVNKFKRSKWFTLDDGEWVELFSEGHRMIIDMDNAKKERYIDSKEKQMAEETIGKHRFGVVHAEQYISELGNVLSERNQHLDFIAIINMSGNKVSLRTTHDNVDVSKIAKGFGGGGHAKASGFSFDGWITGIIPELIFGTGFVKSVYKFIQAVKAKLQR